MNDNAKNRPDDNKDTKLTLESLYNVPVQVSVVLGRTTMQLSNILKLSRGAVIELDRYVGENIDVYVNNKVVAKGEIVIVDDRIGITLTDVISQDKYG